MIPAETPLFWVLGILAVLLAGFSKAASGAGIAVLAVPLLSLVMPTPRAAAIMLPILCLIDLLGIWAFRRHFDGDMLRELMPGALIGIVLGALVFGVVDTRWVKGLLGAECMIFAVNRIVGARQIAQAQPQPRSRTRATWWSAVSGFTSTLAHAGGPPLMQYLLPLKLERMRFLGTTVFFFTAVNYVKLVPYGILGLLDASNLGTSLLLVPAIPLGYGLGFRFARTIPQKPFDAFINWSLLLTGIKLLSDGLFG